MRTEERSVYGRRTVIRVGTWDEIKALGFGDDDRTFGTLNDGTPASFFCRYNTDTHQYEWYATAGKPEDIRD
jgi:hypothetical protein